MRLPPSVRKDYVAKYIHTYILAHWDGYGDQISIAMSHPLQSVKVCFNHAKASRVVLLILLAVVVVSTFVNLQIVC